ncbi:helix-turn-helix transcriptional regulator [Nocardia sp. NPDC055053]
MTSAALSQSCGDSARAVLWIRPGHAGYIGPSLPIGPHSPVLACSAVGLDEPFVFRAPGLDEVTTRSACAPARYSHHLPATPGRMLYLFVDPAITARSQDVRHMRRQQGPFGFQHRNERELITAALRTDIERVVQLASLPLPGAGLDPRIAEAARIIRADPTTPVTARNLAAGVGWSTSHLLRTFAAQTGTTFRRYRQWARMLRVAQSIAAGHNLTRCSTDAGFASPSHLSENFHRLFGLSASALMLSGAQLELDLAG